MNPAGSQNLPPLLIGNRQVLHLDTKGLGLLEPDDPDMAQLRLATLNLSLEPANDHRLEEISGDRPLREAHSRHAKQRDHRQDQDDCSFKPMLQRRSQQQKYLRNAGLRLDVGADRHQIYLEHGRTKNECVNDGIRQ